MVDDERRDLPVAELFEAHRLERFAISSLLKIAETQLVNCLEGSHAFLVVVEECSGLRELRRLDQDLRRRKIWLLLSVKG
jgi:hypothetical protein